MGQPILACDGWLTAAALSHSYSDSNDDSRGQRQWGVAALEFAARDGGRCTSGHSSCPASEHTYPTHTRISLSTQPPQQTRYNTSHTPHRYPTIAMPPRTKSRGHPPQAPPQPSDYETDAPPPEVDVHRPGLAQRSNEELNLSALMRIYPDITDLLHVTPYVVLYTFNEDTEEWDKIGVEGSLFLCQLAPASFAAHRFCAVILNRKGLGNFYIELTTSEDVQVEDPFVIVRGDQVYGVWVFAEPAPSSTANCHAETGAKVTQLAERAQASREANESAGNGHVDRTQALASAPMGREASLREIFDQQREQDADFSAYSHNTLAPPSQPVGTGPGDAGIGQHDVLGQLFMRAKQDYNGHG